MTDVQDEVLPDAEEVQAPPAPAPSDDSPVAGSPGIDPALVEARFAEMESKLAAIDELDERIDARFKSGKDRRYAKVEEIYDWVKAAGGDVGKIKQDVEISELRSQLAALQGTGEAGGTALPGPQSTRSNVSVSTEILGRYQIAHDDAAYLQFVAHSPPQNAEAWELTLEGWAQQHTNKAVKAGSITPAAAVGETGAAPSATGQVDALTVELQEYYAGEHGSLTSSENKKRIKEISAELNKLSPPVNTDA
jgi:hypothetical protein